VAREHYNGLIIKYYSKYKIQISVFALKLNDEVSNIF